MNKQIIVTDQNRIRSKKRRLLQKVANVSCDKDKPSASGDTNSELRHEITDSSEDNGHVDEESNIDNFNQEEREIGEAYIANLDEEYIVQEKIVENMVEDGNDNNENIHEETTYHSSSEDEETDDEETDDEEENHVPVEIFQLREWAINRKICQLHLDELLKILGHRLLPTLPKSSKTFLKTNLATYNIVEMQDSHGGVGHFVYYGIADEIVKCINRQLHVTDSIELIVNFDGLPITKSGSEEFWPILGKVFSNEDIYKPFPIAVFHGQGKPGSLEEYLDSFINEINELQHNGIIIEGKHFDVYLKCVVADAPARAFIKNTLGHCGKFACERCTVEGLKVEGTTVFPDANAIERTNESFRSFKQQQHHHGPTPFFRIIPIINMVALFVLDFMHLCCQGVMKKLLDYWTSGNLNVKLSLQNRNEISRRLKMFRSQIPCEFQRKPRPLKCVAKWKATELRFFLLYACPIVLKGLLKDNLYQHFLLFHSACRILCSKKLCNKYTNHAKHYLTSFFICLKDFYGAKSQSFNAHHLIHLPDDVAFMGCSLSNITASPFENLLGKMRKYLRTAVRPLAQLSRRLFEENLLIYSKKKLFQKFKFLPLLMRARLNLLNLIISRFLP